MPRSSQIKISLLFIFLLNFYSIGFTQTLGLTGPDVNWHSIKSDTAQIIFPEGQEKKAFRVAQIIHHLANNNPTSKQKLQPIKILLQEQSTISNGYVGFGPLRSEFYLQPFEDVFQLGSLPWTDLLSIHEYRHVQQLSATNKGLSHLIYTLLGQNAYAGAAHLAIPDWFLEGDAVIAETAFSNQGRGRLASFTKMFREKDRINERWNYQLLRNGSFKKWLPNQYPLGFIMTNYGRQNYGQDFWNEVVQEGGAYKGLFYSFSNAVKSRSGKNTTEFYEAALDQAKGDWANNNNQENITYSTVDISNKKLSNDSKFINYHMPAVDVKGNVYTIIERFNQIEGIYKINAKGETKRIVSLGIQVDPFFSLNAEKLVWTELRLHPRWQRVDHTQMVVFDLSTNKKKAISLKGKYFMPSINNGGDKIVVLHTNNGGMHELQIIDISSGKIISKIPNSQNYYLGYPSWSPNEDKILVSARNDEGEMAIANVDVASGELKPITHWSYNIFGRALQYDNWIYTSSNINEIDQLYAINPTDGIPYQITDNAKFHYSPSYDALNDDIVFTEFTLYGHRLRKIAANSRNWKTVNLDGGVKYFNTLENEGNILGRTDLPSYEIKKYPKLGHPINIHSLNLTADDPSYELEVLSENILGNVGLSGGYSYNRNNKSYGPFLNATFSYFYPELTAGFRGTYRQIQDPNGNKFTIKQNAFVGGIRVPFQFTSGVFNQALSFSSNINIGKLTLKPEIETFAGNRFAYLSHGFVFQNTKRKAYQHAIPQFGQRIQASFAHGIDSLSVNQFSVISDFSFPGLSSNHVFIFQVDYVREDAENGVTLGEPFQTSRGFSYFENDEAIRFGINYHFPLLYPDAGVAGIAFLKRIRMKPFFDHAIVRINNSHFNFSSVGTELHFDLNVFNVQPVSFGLRWSYALDAPETLVQNKNTFEFFIPFDRL